MIYKSLTPTFRKQFFDLISQSKNTLITAHFSPDDDAIGSTLALKYLLSKKYPKKNIQVAFTGNPIDRFSVFTGYSEIKFVKDIANIIDNYDTLVFLDGSQYPRFSNLTEKIVNSNAIKICLDHHASPTDKFDLHLQKPLASSSSELIFQLIPHGTKLDLPLCECILLGILGDTGTFNYIRPNQYGILSIVKTILEASHIEIQEFKSRYMLMSKKVFFIIQEFIKNSQFLSIKNWPDFQVSYISREFIKENELTDDDVSEANNIFISNYLRLIEGYPWGISFKPHSDGGCTLSLRSLPACVSVRDIVEKIGIGGGHDRAAGGKIKYVNKEINPQDAIKQISDWLKKNKPVII